MGVSRRCLHAFVAEQTADDRQRQTSADGETREAVAQIVDAHVVDAGKFPDAPPGLLQVDQMLARHLADDDIGVARLSRQIGKEFLGRGVEGDDLGAVLVGLMFLEDEPALGQIDARPFQRQDFAKPAAGEDQKTDRSGNIGIDRTIGLAVRQDGRQAFQFVLAQIALALFLRERLDVGGRASAARDHLPALGAIQHGAQQAEHAIGVVGRILKIGVELGDIGGPQFQELSIAEPRPDEALHQPFMGGDRAVLAAPGAMILHVEVAKLIDALAAPGHLPLFGRVLAVGDLAEHALGGFSRLIERQLASLADRQPPAPAVLVAILDDEALGPARFGPKSKAGQAFIPNHHVFISGGDGVDEAFVEFGHVAPGKL